MKPVGITILVIMIFFFGYMIYDDSRSDRLIEQVGADVKRLRTITETIDCYTETNDFTCGTVSFQTNSQSIIDETQTVEVTEEKLVEVIDEDGNVTTETQTVTTTKVIPKVSDANITYIDKQTGDFMVCIRGHQCVIDAQIKLYDNNEKLVDAPYTYQLMITCEHRDFCDRKQTKTTNAGTTTDSLGGVRYSWTTSSADSLGDYEIILNIRSAVLDQENMPITLLKKIPLVLIS